MILADSRSEKPDAKTKVPLALVHTDLSGPVVPISRDGFKYCIAFTDDFSGAVAVYFLKNKTDAVKATGLSVSILVGACSNARLALLSRAFYQKIYLR